MAGQSLSKLSAGGLDAASPQRPTLGNNKPKEHAALGAAHIVGLACIRCGASYPTTLELDSRGCPACHETAPANVKPIYAAPADPRSIAVARRNGVDISGQRARKVAKDDFRTFTHIYALDHDNLDGLMAVAPRDATAEVGLLLDLVPGHEGRAVADPYYGDDIGFEATWTDVVLGAQALARRLVDEGWR